MNSASSCRAVDDKAFFINLRRLIPFLPPPVLNLRIFSRLRLIFSFLALVRQANNGAIVREKGDVVITCCLGANATRGAKAYREIKMLEMEIIHMSILNTYIYYSRGIHVPSTLISQSNLDRIDRPYLCSYGDDNQHEKYALDSRHCERQM
jgi:hypothetical protein